MFSPNNAVATNTAVKTGERINVSRLQLYPRGCRRSPRAPLSLRLAAGPLGHDPADYPADRAALVFRTRSMASRTSGSRTTVTGARHPRIHVVTSELLP